MSTTLRVLTTGTCFAVVLASGFWLSRSGKPLNVGVSTIHKLVALAAAVLLVMTVRRLHHAAPLTAGQLSVTAVTGVLFASLAATGGLLSVDKPMPALVRVVHHLVPYLTIISSAATFYLLLGR